MCAYIKSRFVYTPKIDNYVRNHEICSNFLFSNFLWKFLQNSKAKTRQEKNNKEIMNTTYARALSHTHSVYSQTFAWNYWCVIREIVLFWSRSGFSTATAAARRCLFHFGWMSVSLLLFQYFADINIHIATYTVYTFTYLPRSQPIPYHHQRIYKHLFYFKQKKKRKNLTRARTAIPFNAYEYVCVLYMGKSIHFSFLRRFVYARFICSFVYWLEAAYVI